MGLSVVPSSQYSTHRWWGPVVTTARLPPTAHWCLQGNGYRVCFKWNYSWRAIFKKFHDYFLTQELFYSHFLKGSNVVLLLTEMRMHNVVNPAFMTLCWQLMVKDLLYLVYIWQMPNNQVAETDSFWAGVGSDREQDCACSRETSVCPCAHLHASRMEVL